jgi:hypothetical protein
VLPLSRLLLIEAITPLPPVLPVVSTRECGVGVAGHLGVLDFDLGVAVDRWLDEHAAPVPAMLLSTICELRIRTTAEPAGAICARPRPGWCRSAG